MKQKKSELLIFAMFVFPALAFVLFMADIPFMMNLYYSVFDWNGIGKDMEFVGLGNFVKIFTNDSRFWKSVIFTLKFAVFYVVIVNVVSLTVAMVMSRESKSARVGRAFYYVPYIISMTAISLIWKFILGPGFEALYDITGFEIFNWSWVGSPKLIFYVVVVMAVWQNVGFYMVNYIIMVFTKGGPADSTATVAYNIYKEAFVNTNYGLATAKSLVFVCFVLLVTVIQLKITKSKEVEV